MIKQLNEQKKKTIPLVGPPTMMTATTLSSELPIFFQSKQQPQISNSSVTLVCLKILCMWTQAILNRTATTTLRACHHSIHLSNNK